MGTNYYLIRKDQLEHVENLLFNDDLVHVGKRVGVGNHCIHCKTAVGNMAECPRCGEEMTDITSRGMTKFLWAVKTHDIPKDSIIVDEYCDTYDYQYFLDFVVNPCLYHDFSNLGMEFS